MHFLLMKAKVEAEAQYLFFTKMLHLDSSQTVVILDRWLNEKMEREYDEHRTST